MTNADYYVAQYANGGLGGCKHNSDTVDAYCEVARTGPNPIIGVWHVSLKSERSDTNG